MGLPRTADSRLAVSNDERRLRPFIGNIGTNAYFLARSGTEDESQWWLVGVDVDDGHPLFDAVPLGVLSPKPECFLNGPGEILCVSEFPSQAWVIDGHSGLIGFHGPTDLRLSSGTLVVEQVGVYAVAATQNQGVFGIGPQAETTWFVPGEGALAVEPARQSGAASQTLTSQLETNPRTYVAKVFSVVDGSVLEPVIGESYTLGKTTFYTGGFAAEVHRPNGTFSEIVFFDELGRRVGESEPRGVLDLLPDPIDLPVVRADERTTVYSAKGAKLVDVPSGTLWLVGTTLMVNVGSSRDFPEWQQYNMRDGSAGQVCDYLMHNYIGTDGSTLVFEVHNHEAEVLATASDLHSCERLWTIPKQPGSLDRIWRIDDTLVQLTNEGTELNSLVAPS